MWVLAQITDLINIRIRIKPQYSDCRVHDLNFCGHSMVIDPLGEILTEAEEDEEVLTAEVDFAQVDVIREGIPVFRDRRPKIYEKLNGK